MQTEHVIHHRRPDKVLLHKTERKCHLIDLALPGDKRIVLKEQEKIDNYNELRQEVKKYLKLASTFGCSSCNWITRGDIEKIEKLPEEVRCKE